MTIVADDDTVELLPLLTPGAEGGTVGYTAELGMTGADELDIAEDTVTELRGSGMATV
jgi:hypothetical protein